MRKRLRKKQRPFQAISSEPTFQNEENKSLMSFSENFDEVTSEIEMKKYSMKTKMREILFSSSYINIDTTFNGHP
jgi:hypothetical protein